MTLNFNQKLTNKTDFSKKKNGKLSLFTTYDSCVFVIYKKNVTLAHFVIAQVSHGKWSCVITFCTRGKFVD